MSRGPGRIQQAILALIASDEHGAWRTVDICQHAYPGVNRVEKKHRVAVIRALTGMILPEPWEARVMNSPGSEFVLTNVCDFESRARKVWFEEVACGWGSPDFADYRRRWSHRFEPGSVFDNALERDRRYYEADEIGRLDMRIKEARSGAAGLAGLGWRDAATALIEEAQALEKQKAELTA